MPIDYSTTPIGLAPVIAAVESSLAKAQCYRRCGLKPPHFIINLAGGNGQTTLTAYIAEAYAGGGIRRFDGLDPFLEYTLDGSMAQLRKAFADIRACAVYTNEYEGVIAMDITKLADHINEDQLAFFLEETAKLAAHATFIFYLSPCMTRNTAALLRKLHGALDDVALLNIQPYTPEELAQITKRMILDAGVMLEEDDRVDTALLEAVRAEAVCTVKAAQKLSRAMIKRASFSAFAPSLRIGELESIAQSSNSVKREGK